MDKVKLKKVIPRGRKRQGWKKVFLETLNKAAEDIGEVPEEKISRAVRTYRGGHCGPNITPVTESHRCRKPLVR